VKFISHRGNISEKNIFEENRLDKILYCINLGYDVEIDIWEKNDIYYLGHDEPQYEIHRDFLLKNNKKLWCHAKNLIALESMLSLRIVNCFWHQNDDYTITSKGYIWAFPSKKVINNCVAVMPEKSNYLIEDLKKCYGICSDNIQYYKNILG
jgi:hypothetical protein